MKRAALTSLLQTTGPRQPLPTTGGPADADPFRLAFLRAPQEDVAACAATVQEACTTLGPPPEGEGAARLATVDGDAAARVAIGHAAALCTEPLVEKAAGASAQAQGALCEARQLASALHLECEAFREEATDTGRVIASAIGYIDGLAQALVHDVLASGTLTAEAQQALIIDFTPRLAFLLEEAEAAEADRARAGRRLAPLARDAEDAEEETSALRTFQALRAGQALAPGDVVAALSWERRRKDEEEAAALRALGESELAAPAPAAAARARSRRR